MPAHIYDHIHMYCVCAHPSAAHTQFALQVLPVVFAVSATLTPSDLGFSVKEMDFGCVGLHESVLSSMTITNTSSLVQEIGFVNVPNVRTYVCTYMLCVLVCMQCVGVQ